LRLLDLDLDELELELELLERLDFFLFLDDERDLDFSLKSTLLPFPFYLICQ